jgi:hypothetical protein
MAKLPVYEQQTRAESPVATPESMGGGMARATQDIGRTLADIGETMQRRESTIDRVQQLNSFDQEAVTSLEALQADESIASKSTLDKYQQALRQSADQKVAKHTGSGESRAALRAQLDNQVGQYTKSAMGAQIKAQHGLIGKSIQKSANALALTAGMAPDQYVNALSQFDSDLSQFEGSINKDMLTEYRESGRSQIVTSAVNSLVQSGQYDSAKALMTDPTIAPLLTADAGRQFSMNIAVGRYKNEQEITRQNQNVSKFTMALGRNLTPEEQIKVRMLPEKKNMTAADEIMQLEIVQGKPASQAQVSDILGVKGQFGDSLQGRALNYITDNATRYANGMMTPDERLNFEVSYNEAYKPIEKTDPVTGMITKITPAIPPFIQQAMTRGARFGGGGGGAPRPAAPAAPPAMPGGGGGAPAASSVAPVQADGGQPIPSNPSDQRSIWDRRANIVGPVATARSAIQSVPGVGPAAATSVFGAEETRQADADRVYVENASRDLVRVLQNNPKFAEGERKAIEKEISVGPEMFRSVESYEGKLIGINQSLQDRLNDAQKTLTSQVSLEERKRATDNINAITQFRQKLGLPIMVKTAEDAQRLAPGTRFMDPSGNEFTKR